MITRITIGQIDSISYTGSTICLINTAFITYDHSFQKTRDPVRSPIDKLESAELVLGSVTTWESSVLYVFYDLFDLLVLVVPWFKPVNHPKSRTCVRK